jgi:hypothetical protein
MRYAIVVILIIFFGVVGTIFLIGRGNRRNAVQNQPQVVHVADYVNDDASLVSWTMQGRIVGKELRRAVQITVTPSERRVELFEGYNQKVTKSLTLPNDTAAYTHFLLALENLNFGRERKVKQPDERGVCPLGTRYIYEVRSGSEQKSRLWSDSCASADGTFAGVAITIKQLFKNQIPEYEKFISGVQF